MIRHGIIAVWATTMAFGVATIPLEAAHSVGRTWNACVTDEVVPGVKCVWDAKHQGNGEGRSYFVNAKGQHFISHARAHRMQGR